jgi:hypothetical protein
MEESLKGLFKPEMFESEEERASEPKTCFSRADGYVPCKVRFWPSFACLLRLRRLLAADCPLCSEPERRGGLGDLDLFRLEEEEHEDNEGEGTLRLDEDEALERVSGTRRESRCVGMVSSSWSRPLVKVLVSEGEGALRLDEDGAPERVSGTWGESGGVGMVSSSWSGPSVKVLVSCNSSMSMELLWMISCPDMGCLYYVSIYHKRVTLPEIVEVIILFLQSRVRGRGKATSL